MPAASMIVGANVADVVVLAADFTLRLDAVRPVHDEVILLTAAMFGLLEITERRVAGHRPARVVMRIGIRAAPVFEIPEVRLERRLQAIEHVGLVECAGEAAFSARAVVGRDEYQRIVEFADPFEFGDDAADLQVDPFHLRGEHLHLAGVEFLFRLRQRVPGRNLVDALRELSIRGDDTEFFLAGQDLLPRPVPAHVELAAILVDMAVRGVMRQNASSRTPTAS